MCNWVLFTRTENLGIGGFGFLGILPRVSFKPDPSNRSDRKDAFVSPWPSRTAQPAWLISRSRLPTHIFPTIQVMTLINVDKIHGGRFFLVYFLSVRTRKNSSKVFTFDGLWECQSIVSWCFLVNSSDRFVFWMNIKDDSILGICRRSIPNKPLLLCYMYL